MLFSQNFSTNTNNLSGTAISIFRRYFRSSRPSAFFKIGVLKIFAKFFRLVFSRFLDLRGNPGIVKEKPTIEKLVSPVKRSP